LEIDILGYHRLISFWFLRFFRHFQPWHLIIRSICCYSLFQHRIEPKLRNIKCSSIWNNYFYNQLLDIKQCFIASFVACMFSSYHSKAFLLLPTILKRPTHYSQEWKKKFQIDDAFRYLATKNRPFWYFKKFQIIYLLSFPAFNSV
jgi:hypothetical protein